MKRIQRVKTDHGKELGIRLKEARDLVAGDVLFMDENNMIIIDVLTDDLLIISPRSIMEMGIIAHQLGNRHLPAQFEGDDMLVQYDYLVAALLEELQIPYQREDRKLCDSNFPTGAFSHSYGLETYIQEGTVNNQVTFSTWLDVYLNEQLVYADGLASRIVYQALEKNRLEEVWKIDRMLTVQNLPRETREGTQRIGERMLKLVETLYNVPIITQYQERIKKKQSFGHPAIVFTIIGHYLKVSGRETTLYYLYSNLTSLVQNAVRAIPLGQTAGQKTIQQFQPLLVKQLKKSKA
uniref:Urease accessory protein UreE n=1 Tax=Batrachochytrium dendrobatidis (strain JAM81 / FGSC 10211) TaxID=684364 RepID=F4PG09_BATDJ|eukprot:XP_006683541.1 hypothetical protein BATDEDRAFT_93298 [Batrachochytrium dendrobatidis JAM81]